jgi:CRISPR-associated protein Csx17
VHELTGLRPDALATYLAGLGALRLLAEQLDAEIRGFWRGEHFVLVTQLGWQDIEKFFVENYAPTPILSPWNMESGFFSLKAKASEEGADASQGVDRDSGAEDESEAESEDGAEQAVGDPLLARLAESSAERFAALRRAIEVALAAIPADVRQAEEDVRRAHEMIRQRSVEHGAAYERVCQELKNAQVDVAAAGKEKQMAAAELGARGPAARPAFQAAEQRLKGARERERICRRQKDRLARELKEVVRRAARDPDLRARVSDAKKRFKEVQSSTKDRLIADLRGRWGEDGRQWIDAAAALDESGNAVFTSLFGSGGNDGRMEFTKNFRRHLGALFDVVSGNPREKAAAKLRAALFGSPANVLASEPVGQFFPGRAGGTNMGAGFFGGAVVNSWEFILMLEGAVALVAGMTRRGEVGRARVASPFWVEAAAAGFGSASQQERAPRGEQWLPLWSQPLRYMELTEIVREGRAQVGRQQTMRAGDLVRATARLGLARAIDSLQRFAYLQRNGQSNLAVFTGRFYVRSRSHQALVDEIAPWIDRLVWHAKQTKENNVSVSLGLIARRTQDALFSVCRREATPRDWRGLLVAVGEAEFALLRSGKNPARRPLPPLSREWITAVDDATPQGRCALRLALAFSSQHRPVEKENGGVHFTDSIRQHFMPLEAGDGSRPRFKLDDRGRPAFDPERVCAGRDLVADAIAVVERRSLWARALTNERERSPKLPLQAMRGCEATLDEVGAWVRGEVRDADVFDLVRPLLALDWARMHVEHPLVAPAPRGVPEPLHMLLRLAHLPFSVPVWDEEERNEVAVTVRLDREPLRRLAAGDLGGAVRVAVRRLEASGLRPVFRRAVNTPGLARRLAASLALPISQQGAARAARLICKPYAMKGEERPAVPA